MGGKLGCLFGGRKRRDEQAAQWLTRVRWRVGQTEGAFIVHVQEVQRCIANGTKAYVWVEDGGWRGQDTFFWHYFVRAGETLAVQGRQGWGPHTMRPDVLFIGSDVQHGVYESLPVGTAAAAERHFRRVQKG